jgi:predicted nicotinamide N-methyase
MATHYPHLKTIAGLQVPYARHPRVRAIKRQGHHPSIHGTKLWSSSDVLIDYIASTSTIAPQSVIDAGCGWGLSGIWCAKTFGSAVASIDADASVMPYLELIAELNEVEVTPIVARFDQLHAGLLGATDWLIAADVCFWEELIDPLTSMIERAVENGPKRIMISDPRREPFFNVADTILSKYGGELVEWRVGDSRHSGVILIIENT